MSLPIVAIVTPGSFVIPSSTSSSVELVVQHVVPHLTREVRPIVFGKAAKSMPSCEKRGEVTYIRTPAPTPQAYVRQVGHKLQPYKQDLNLIQVENRPRYVRYLRKMYPDTAIWLVLHSITFISKPYLHGAQLRACLASADRIIVNSHFLKDQVIRKVPQAAGKIRVNHLGTDPDQFIPRWTELGMVRRQMDLHRAGLEDKKIVMFVGRLIRIKGVHLLLKAWPNIIKQVPNAVLLIVGSAFYGSKRLTPYVKRLHYYGNKMRRHVRFVPYIPHSEIQNWFRMADVLVVPSSVKEAFGLVNVEAMASGVPVVATRAGGMKEIIEHGRTGYLIKASNLQDELAPRIVSLLTDPGLVEAMGMESVRRVEEHFTWARTAERLLEMYKHET